LRNSREQLRNLAAYLQRAREEERTHVAREIHDELGQSLTALKMDAALIQDIIDEEPENLKEILSNRIVSASNLIDSTVKTVRKISTDLRPAVLDNLGLLPAIEWQAEEFQNRTGINCETFITVEDVDLSQEYQTAVFRILQESLTNVMRHADASLVTIEFRKDETSLVFEIKDNGKGISESNMKKENSFGLIGIKERAYVFGGDAVIKGIPGKGTCVSVNIPLR
jgi:signal transduction histidine kinase